MLTITVSELLADDGSRQDEFKAEVQRWNDENIISERLQFVTTALGLVTDDDTPAEVRARTMELLLMLQPIELLAFALLELEHRGKTKLFPEEALTPRLAAAVKTGSNAHQAHALVVQLTAPDGQDLPEKEDIKEACKQLAELTPIDLVMFVADAVSGKKDSDGDPVSATLVQAMAHSDVAQQMATVMDESQRRITALLEAEEAEGQTSDEQSTDDTTSAEPSESPAAE
jgi:hypothetical protein